MSVLKTAGAPPRSGRMRRGRAGIAPQPGLWPNHSRQRETGLAVEATRSTWRPSMYSPVVPAARRKRPPAGLAAHLIEQAENRCAYCTLPIGATAMRRGRAVCLRREWDHFRPYSVIYSNPRVNWQLACHVCNQIKSANRFDTVEDAAQVILRGRSHRGYESVRDTWARLVDEPYSPWGDPPNTGKVPQLRSDAGAQ